eukprot:5227733-Pyramimonas_sp.AAC.1
MWTLFSVLPPPILQVVTARAYAGSPLISTGGGEDGFRMCVASAFQPSIVTLDWGRGEGAEGPSNASNAAIGGSGATGRGQQAGPSSGGGGQVRNTDPSDA